MGSGLSLTHKQVIYIIKRDLYIDFQYKQSILPRYTDDGYEIFYDYSDEVILNNIMKEIDLFVKNR
jgi:hypothetical protein